MTSSFVSLAAVFVVVLAVLSYNMVRNHDLAVQGNQAHVALCSLKNDYRLRVHQKQVFLVENPNGIPGVKANVIRALLKNQLATLRALRVLHC